MRRAAGSIRAVAPPEPYVVLCDLPLFGRACVLELSVPELLMLGRDSPGGAGSVGETSAGATSVMPADDSFPTAAMSKPSVPRPPAPRPLASRPPAPRPLASRPRTSRPRASRPRASTPAASPSRDCRGMPAPSSADRLPAAGAIARSPRTSDGVGCIPWRPRRAAAGRWTARPPAPSGCRRSRSRRGLRCAPRPRARPRAQAGRWRTRRRVGGSGSASRSRASRSPSATPSSACRARPSMARPCAAIVRRPAGSAVVTDGRPGWPAEKRDPSVAGGDQVLGRRRGAAAPSTSTQLCRCCAPHGRPNVVNGTSCASSQAVRASS